MTIEETAASRAHVHGVVMRRPIPPNVWISVDESMPPIGMDCLVFMPKAYTKIGVETCYNDGRWNPTWADGWKKGQRYEITHWMMVTPPVLRSDITEDRG